ncbi:transposase [Microbacterium maritypicum]
MLSDGQWSLIEGMLPRPTGRPGRKFSDARLMVEGIIYRHRCGIAWRDLPEVFGPWQRCGPGITGWLWTGLGMRCSWRSPRRRVPRV